MTKTKSLLPIKIEKLSSKTSLEDWTRVRELCCLTGKNGAPIEKERWPFFSELWVGPYQKFSPDWTYVARTGASIVGYLTGCPNTKEFEHQKLYRFIPRLIFNIARSKYEYNLDTRRFLRRSFGFEKGPESCFSDDIKESLASQYPAHLHINLDASCRGSGIGHLLMDQFCQDLKNTGVAGLHVFCGADPVQFYLREGFSEVGQISFGRVPVFALGKKL